MSPSKKAFFSILGVLLFVLGSGAGVFYLLDGQLVELNATIGRLKAEQKAAKSQIGIYESTRTKVSELAFVEDLANSVLPNEKEQANTIAELRKFVIDSGMQFESISFAGSDQKAIAAGRIATTQTEKNDDLPGVLLLPANVVIGPGASYDQVLSLLRTIETNQRKMQVTNLTLLPDETGERFSSITLDVDIYLSAGL